MIVILGCILVTGSVLIGFMMAGGNPAALIHPSEFVTIGGAAFGALVLMSPKKVIIDLFKCCIGLVKGSPFSKKMHAELFKFLYDIGRTVRRDGLLALEALVGSHNGPLYKKYPLIDKNHHVKDFLCDALSVIAEGKSDPKVLAAEFEEDIHMIEREHHAAVGALVKTADALPGFGIVAAVLGIVVTMQAIGGPVEEIGHKVGAALVGTFLGILLSYGFFAPMAARMDSMGTQESSFFRAIAAGLVAISAGETPRDIVSKARRSVGTEVRPNKTEMNALLKEVESGS
jgi:chemotaxis protein MotA